MLSETAVMAASGAAAMVLACMGGLSAHANTDHRPIPMANSQIGAPTITRIAARPRARACPPRIARRARLGP